MLRCLIAEDDCYIQEMLKERVRDFFKAEVVMVDSGNMAIEILKTDRKFDFIISDNQMLNGTGPEVLDYLVENNIEIPFAYFTSLNHAGPEEVPNNFVGIFAKSDFEELAKTIFSRLRMFHCLPV